MRISLIIPAGGSGSRFRVRDRKLSQRLLPNPRKAAKSVLPASKLFYELEGKPLLTYALNTLQQVKEIQETIIAVPDGSEGAVRAFVKEQNWKNAKVTQGGKTRAESVKKALAKSDRNNHWVMVHDGARPFANLSAIKRLLKMASTVDGAILAKKVVPTIKAVKSRNRIDRTVDRNVLFEAETPQLMRRSLLTKAYQMKSTALAATDEASLLEAIGGSVKVVPHEGWNPKITTFEDFQLAGAYLRSGQGQIETTTRTGIGKDTHRLVSGRKFWLGGVHIPFEKGPLGHSDGDALLHAITDALLGATGLGDIGEWFSDKNPKFKNITSTKMLREVLGGVQKNHWEVQHVDTIVILEKPKLSKYKTKIRSKIASILGIAIDQVSVKAKTQEGLGPEGRGEAITCEAVVTVQRKCHD